MLDLITTWLCSAIAGILNWFCSFFEAIFSYDMKTFNNAFSFAITSYSVIRSIGLALALLIAAWSIVTFFIRGADTVQTTPIKTALSSLVAIGFIYWGNYIFEIIMKLCQYPFNAIERMGVYSGDYSVGDFFNVSSAGIGSMITTSIETGLTGITPAVYLLILTLLAFSFIKLLLEIVERYVVACTLVYLSPLASATLASDTTKGIYKKYFVMFISQCVLIFLNLWCLKMALSALQMIGSDNALIIDLLLCYAFLRISTKMDSYINQLGLNAAITGEGLGAEIIGAGMAMANGMGNRQGGNGLGSPVGGNGRVLGGIGNASRSISNAFAKVSPLTAIGRSARDTIVGGAKGASEAFRSGGNVLKGLGTGIATGAKNSDNLYSNVARKPSKFADTALSDKKLSALASSEANANSLFSYYAKGKAEIPSDDAAHVSATMQGLGLDQYSQETANCIAAGYGRDGVDTSKISYSLGRTGIHAEYDLNGYRHKTDVVNPSQYSKLSTKDRFGYEQFKTPQGRTYYVRNTKTQHETKQKTEKPAPGGSDDNSGGGSKS